MKDTAIIGGVGAHQDLGLAVARRFAAGNGHVMIAGRTEDRLHQRANETKAPGGSVSICTIDGKRLIMLKDVSGGYAWT